MFPWLYYADNFCSRFYLFSFKRFSLISFPGYLFKTSHIMSTILCRAINTISYCSLIYAILNDYHIHVIIPFTWYSMVYVHNVALSGNHSIFCNAFQLNKLYTGTAESQNNHKKTHLGLVLKECMQIQTCKEVALMRWFILINQKQTVPTV